jgi:hypothetical protein
MHTLSQRLVAILVVGLLCGQSIAQDNGAGGIQPALQAGPAITPPGTPPANGAGVVPGAGAAAQPAGQKTQSSSKPQSVTDLTVDLANPERMEAVTPGAYRLKLINKLPMADYEISSKVISNAIPAPIDLSGKQTQPTPSPTQNPSCSPAQTAIVNTLKAAVCEQQVAQTLATVRSVLSASGCNDTEISGFQTDVADMTTRTDDNALPVVTDGDELTVTIVRGAFYGASQGACGNVQAGPAPNGLPGVTIASKPLGSWHFDFGKKQAQWLTYYGFNFTHAGDQSFYSKSNEGSNPVSYTITPQANRHSSDFSASIYLMRLPAEDGFTPKKILGWRENDWMGGLTAGLGFDFSNPTVFLGYGIGWGYNVMLTGGVVMHQETRLKGQYNAGQVITTNLTPDQLVDSTYKPAAYIGIAIRLGSNPFSGSNSSKSSTNSKTTTNQNTGS